VTVSSVGEEQQEHIGDQMDTSTRKVA
jgi:hypothetical protein